MTMPMVRIGKVWVGMGDGFVSMAVTVTTGRWPGFVVRVPMMLIVGVLMLVFERFMAMRVAVPFGQMQPDADGHQRSGDPGLDADRFMQQRNGQHRAEERRHREVRAGAGDTELT